MTPLREILDDVWVRPCECCAHRLRLSVPTGYRNPLDASRLPSWLPLVVVENDLVRPGIGVAVAEINHDEKENRVEGSLAGWHSHPASSAIVVELPPMVDESLVAEIESAFDEAPHGGTTYPPATPTLDDDNLRIDRRFLG